MFSRRSHQAALKFHSSYRFWASRFDEEAESTPGRSPALEVRRCDQTAVAAMNYLL
jgi:hypothetical protein